MEGSIDDKTDVHFRPHVDVAYTPDDELVVQKHGTENDVQDMARMGKVQSLRVKPYQLKSKLSLNSCQRNFGYYSILGFSMILMSSWETQTAWAQL